MKFLKVLSKHAEKIRLELIDAGILSKDYEIFSKDNVVFFPVLEKFKDFEIVELDVEKKEQIPSNLRQALAGLLTKEELQQLTTSFDIIGDITIVEIPESLIPKEKEIGKALLDVHRNVRAVFKKLGPMEGEYRVRELGLIAGENKTETIYKEHGVSMKFDVSKVYFSVRLSHERKRIAELVKRGEKILALFAGVGPFPLVISKKHPDTEIVAIEINPEAVKYMKENIALNKARNIVTEQGDARKIVMEKYQDFADRIIMPLPKSAHEFLDIAFAGAKDGVTIHFYTLADAENPFENAMEKVKKTAKENNVEIELLSKRIVRPYSKDLVQVVLDLKVRKN